MYEKNNLSPNAQVKRCGMIWYVNVADDTTVEPEWEILGAGIEEASQAKTVNTTTKTDILCKTTTTVDSVDKNIDLAPVAVRGGENLLAKLHDIDRRDANEEYSQFEIMTVRTYYGVEGAYDAEIYEGCTIYDTREGGSAWVDTDLTIALGGNKVLGTADIADIKAPIFTAETAPIALKTPINSYND